jgi:hypothetical protein
MLNVEKKPPANPPTNDYYPRIRYISINIESITITVYIQW